MAALQRYLVPCSAGVAFAVRSPAADPRRRLLLALLGGAADTPIELPQLAAHAGLANLRDLAPMLFQMQRDDWVHCELEPLGPSPFRPEEAWPDALAKLSSEGVAVLASGAGLCVASAGLARSQTERIAALAADMPLSLRGSRDRTSAHDARGVLGYWELPSVPGARKLSAVALHVGARFFPLVVAGVPQLGTRAFIDLIGQLARRYGPRAT